MLSWDDFDTEEAAKETARQEAIAANLGQAVVVDNKAGAVGTIGTENVARSPADGYTLFITTVGIHAIHPSLYAKLPFDAVRDFTAVSLLAAAPFVLVVHPSVPAKSVKDLIALAKAKPNALNYSSAGVGSPLHMSAELFKKRVDIAPPQVELVNFFAGDINNRDGVRLAVKDLDGDYQADLLVGLGSPGVPQVRAFRGKDITSAGQPGTLFDLNPSDIGYISRAHALGLGEMDLKNIKFV